MDTQDHILRIKVHAPHIHDAVGEKCVKNSRATFQKADYADAGDVKTFASLNEETVGIFERMTSGLKVLSKGGLWIALLLHSITGAWIRMIILTLHPREART